MRYLLPHPKSRARTHLRNLRYDTLPRLRHLAQSRIYNLLVNRQLRKGQRKASGIFARLRQRSLLFWGKNLKDDSLLSVKNMSYRGIMPGFGGASGSGGGDDTQPGQSGGKRKKLAGYLKAANDLRQAYSATWSAADQSSQNYQGDIPGSFPDAAVIRGGDDEMVLFPSYARKHVRAQPRAQPGTIQEVGGAGRDSRDTLGAGDAEFWKEQWEKYENDKAIVDVDVRGWIYNPHKGPLSRKHRLMVGLARQLVGLPNPSGVSSSGSSRPTSRSSSPTRDAPTRQEEEMVSKQAEEIVRKGEAEVDIAGQGGFSERPSKDADGDSIYGAQSRNSSPVRHDGDYLAPKRTNTSASSLDADISPFQKRNSWTQPGKMTPAELNVANAHLMSRLKPFMANPIANLPISVFFYNDEMSRQRTIYTDSSGHFHLRAALDFVPTNVRVLASDKLSATEGVHITSSRGVSIISDIDDTIKHSAITSGAREIFRNAFIRDLGDLTIEGVKQWYNRLANMGVQVHYVSNSPWQLYPLLSTFFKMAGLPRGSYHLKQYSGMLQGIFEPVAERKKATLDRLMSDFPERKFILIGDSGEADLEVYTDVVVEYPGRVLGVFIRDVTTQYPRSGFFDPSMGPLSGGNGGRRHTKNMSTDSLVSAKHLSRPDDIQDDEAELRAAIAASLRDMEEETAHTRKSIFSEQPVAAGFPASDTEDVRPRLPPRLPTDLPALQPSVKEENLIDFSDDEAPSPQLPIVSRVERAGPRPALSHAQTDLPIRKTATPPPAPPAKPSQFRKPSGEAPAQSLAVGSAKVRPPKPRKPSTTINTKVPSPLSQNSPLMTSPPEKSGPRASAMKRLSSAYNHLPSAPSYLGGSHGRPGTQFPEEARPSAARTVTSLSKRSTESLRPPQARDLAPPPPPRRNLSSYPAAAAQYASNRLSGNWGGESTNDPYVGGSSSNAYQSSSPINKKEEMWKRRWTRAKEMMDAKGVVLRAWRVGADVEDVSVKLVQDELKQVEELEKDELRQQQEESNKKERQEAYRRKQRQH